MLSKGDIHREITTLFGEQVGHAERRTRLDRLHAIIEIVHVDLEELAVLDRRQLGFSGSCLPERSGHDTHYKGQLDLLLCSINIELILNVDTRSSVACSINLMLLSDGLGISCMG